MKRNVGQLMTSDVVSVGPWARFKEIVGLMTEHKVSALPVVDEAGRLLGINEGAQDVQVDVEDGDVFLRGHVARRSLAEGIADFAREIEGVVSIRKGIEWDLDDISNGAYSWVGSVMPPGRW